MMAGVAGKVVAPVCVALAAVPVYWGGVASLQPGSGLWRGAPPQASWHEEACSGRRVLDLAQAGAIRGAGRDSKGLGRQQAPARARSEPYSERRREPGGPQMALVRSECGGRGSAGQAALVTRTQRGDLRCAPPRADSGSGRRKLGLSPPGRHTSVLRQTSSGLGGPFNPGEPVNAWLASAKSSARLAGPPSRTATCAEA
jgi:hypothetical protein